MNAMPEVTDSFIAARLTDSGATIEQIKGGQLSATINLERGQVQFVIDQLSGARTEWAEPNNRDQRVLEVFYFGDGKDPRSTGPKCNACGVDIGPWHGKRELHIAFHEQLKATPIVWRVR